MLEPTAQSAEHSSVRAILSKSDLLLDSLTKFYRVSGNKELIVPIVKQQTTISLRLLDWLVTNYSKENDVQYEIPRSVGKKNFNIWLDYKNQLKAYSKRNFDPFCRRKRIFYNIVTDEITPVVGKNIDVFQQREDGFVTTVGQLNFFRWALNHRVVDYAFDNLETFETNVERILSKPGPVFVALKVHPEVNNTPIGQRKKWLKRSALQSIEALRREIGIAT